MVMVISSQKSINETRGQQYEDFSENYYSQAIHTEHAVTEALLSEEEWRGRYGPCGQTIRDVYLFGKDSKLNSTGISELNRNKREQQSVGSRVATSCDDTWSTLNNYNKKEMEDAECIHTNNVETGELASIVILTSTECEEFSHAAEQFSKHPNVKPKMHVTDNYQVNKKFFLEIFGTIELRLGLFYYIQRMILT